MEVGRKKSIAKEVIIFFSFISLCIFMLMVRRPLASFIAPILYNSEIENNRIIITDLCSQISKYSLSINRLNTKISLIRDSIASAIPKVSSKPKVSSRGNWRDLREFSDEGYIVKSNPLIANIQNQIDNLQIPEGILKDNIFDSRSKLLNIISNKNAFIEDRKGNVKYAFLSIFLLLYPIRYSYYSIKWAINVLKKIN